MQLFPRRSPDEKARSVKEAATLTGLFLVLALAGFGVFLFGGPGLPPGDDGVWNVIRWIALLLGLASAYITAQCVLSLVVEATVGPERYFAFILLLLAIWGLWTWLS